jgi:hypothetical protein
MNSSYPLVSLSSSVSLRSQEQLFMQSTVNARVARHHIRVSTYHHSPGFAVTADDFLIPIDVHRHEPPCVCRFGNP